MEERDGGARAEARPISIAIAAMGGQGGGVLAGWIITLAERNGWFAQSTSVPGVAQRTGATLYYLELIRWAGPLDRDSTPPLALMPVPGSVDVVIAAEWMEAGRAIQKGLVTPDRTTLIASTHRALSVQEKSAPGDGIADSGRVRDAALHAARRLVAGDMAALAERHGSVISAALFGALAGSGALPFASAQFEEAIRSAGVGVERSLAAFRDAARMVAADPPVAGPGAAPPEAPLPSPDRADARIAQLQERVRRELPPALHDLAEAACRRLADYQDPDYAWEFLDRIRMIGESRRAVDGAANGHAILEIAIRRLAAAMMYEDVMRVADLKIRASRFSRLQKEAGLLHGQTVMVTDYFHPRVEEICGSLPESIGAYAERSRWLGPLLGRAFARGRRIRTGTVRGFILLALLARYGKYRRRTLRHGREMRHLDAWLSHVRRIAGHDEALAIEVLQCRVLVKGYGDTHGRGQGKFDRIMQATLALEGRPDAADWVRRLRDIARRDEEGSGLDGALATIDSFLREDVAAAREQKNAPP